MNRYRKYGVARCEDTESPRHRFPNPAKEPARFHVWLKACDNEDFNNWSSEQIYKRKKVCRLHFANEHLRRNLFLSKNAVPTDIIKVYI